jgi:hypothetical protein
MGLDPAFYLGKAGLSFRHWPCPTWASDVCGLSTIVHSWCGSIPAQTIADNCRQLVVGNAALEA